MPIKESSIINYSDVFEEKASMRRLRKKIEELTGNAPMGELGHIPNITEEGVRRLKELALRTGGTEKIRALSDDQLLILTEMKPKEIKNFRRCTQVEFNLFQQLEETPLVLLKKLLDVWRKLVRVILLGDDLLEKELLRASDVTELMLKYRHKYKSIFELLMECTVRFSDSELDTIGRMQKAIVAKEKNYREVEDSRHLNLYLMMRLTKLYDWKIDGIIIGEAEQAKLELIYRYIRNRLTWKKTDLLLQFIRKYHLLSSVPLPQETGKVSRRTDSKKTLEKVFMLDNS